VAGYHVVIMKQVNEDTTLAEILKIPGAIGVLAKYNLPCLSCPFAGREIQDLKIGDVCKMYGINMQELIKELNLLLLKKK